MGLPILLNHRYDLRPIGHMGEDWTVHFTPEARITVEGLRRIFGSTGVGIVDVYVEGSHRYVKVCKILHWSHSPEPAVPAEPKIAWPLGINTTMDEHAASYGLAHWSCTSPDTNECWVRRDGRTHFCKFDMYGGYPAELRRVDERFPVGKLVFGA